MRAGAFFNKQVGDDESRWSISIAFVYRVQKFCRDYVEVPVCM